MPLFSLFFLFKYIFGKLRNNKNNKYIERPSAVLLQRSDYKNIPYEDLWKSAIRCKLIYHNHKNICALWKFVNKPEDTQEIINSTDIDEDFIHELRDVSEPQQFDTNTDFYGRSHRYNTSAYIWNTDDTIFITFHVDKHIEKKFLKIQTELETISGCIAVNKFFYKELLTLLRPMIAHLDTFADKPFKVVITGYSLGGIIVQIASAIFGQMYPNFHICCHTFGSPKAGNCSFVKWFNNYVKENYRIINGNDPITMFPINYRWLHTSNMTLQFDKDAHMNILYKDTAWYKKLWIKPYIIKEIMEQHKHDHDFHIYITRLWKYLRITNYVESSRQIVEPI